MNWDYNEEFLGELDIFLVPDPRRFNGIGDYFEANYYLD